MSFFQRLVQRFRRPDGILKEIDITSIQASSMRFTDPRPKRTVKYRASEDMWKYIGGNRRLAVQWSAWLTHTRPDPPTIEELQRDMVRQERVRMNVAQIEARDREDDQLWLESQASTLASTSRVDAPSAPIPPENSPPSPPPDPVPAPAVDTPPQTSKSPFPTTPPSDEPQAWTPHAVGRGQ
ncbi:hypothetical protein C8J57DRAFT_1562344 [Mycena rebaudengoi]|nr:hypothetical protein C8J57DRAFT_1562344 [Mycena rebaudengoi]